MKKFKKIIFALFHLYAMNICACKFYDLMGWDDDVPMQPMRESVFHGLPTEIVHHILSYADMPTLWALHWTSKKEQALVQDFLVAARWHLQNSNSIKALLKPAQPTSPLYYLSPLAGLLDNYRLYNAAILAKYPGREFALNIHMENVELMESVCEHRDYLMELTLERIKSIGKKPYSSFLQRGLAYIFLGPNGAFYPIDGATYSTERRLFNQLFGERFFKAKEYLVTQERTAIHASLEGRGLSTIPLELAHLRRVVTIDLQKNSLKFLPSWLIEINKQVTFPVLMGLNLRHNNLLYLPQEISGLSRLHVLALDGNKDLQSLPDTLVELRELDYISLPNTPAMRNSPALAALRQVRGAALTVVFA